MAYHNEPCEGIRVLLAEDHDLVRLGFRALLADQTDILLVGEAATCRDAMTLAAQENPDIILLTLTLGGESTVDCVPKLLALRDELHVLMFTASRDVELHRLAIRYGASGIVSKDQSGETLLKAIRRVHAGELWVDRGMTAALLRESQRKEYDPGPNTQAGRVASLTRRERDIAVLISKGFTTHKISETLCISEKTVRNQLVAVYDKLGVANRIELAIQAGQLGLSKASPQ